ncbi:integrase, catalytic region, zinc finger, CCHC-type containing protein [Tanacetum coccineum]|uniref:Integrase, catalytic region, zinc finger, CCHC-type containing protein n=1 Tax=Tanacetum coccineum TaxID=301880 RepID=A0ABQ5DYR6_9ASTR
MWNLTFSNQESLSSLAVASLQQWQDLQAVAFYSQHGSTKSLLKKEFDMKELGEAKKILGMEIVRDQRRKILRVSQSGYVSKILNNFRIDNGKSVKMPLVGHFKLSLKDCPIRDCDVERMSKVPYANAVGSLMYLMVCTRPDIAYAVDVTGFVDSDYAKDPDKGRNSLIAESCFHERTKHINVRYHFIREVLEAKTINVLKVGTEHNAVDALTKVVPGLKLQHCLELLNVGADNRPPMWTRPFGCDRKATNIILQGLPADIYSLMNHHRVAKDLWERVQLLMQGTSLTKQERECKLYDAFDKFTHIKGELLHTYYLRFTQLINDMNIYKMKMEQFQVNTKFLNSLPPEWSKFVTDAMLLKFCILNFVQSLCIIFEQHELYANEVCIMRERNHDPLSFVANQQMKTPHFNPYQSSYNNPQLPQQFSPSQYGSIQPTQHYSSTYPSQQH